jgi:Domain of unknown function (DUF4391)
MFVYPKQAEFNRVVPKNKIYTHGRVSKRIKGLFVAQVGEILWRYKLSPETINLPTRNGIKEIQVFEIILKETDLDPDVLVTMDKAIPFPLVFEIKSGELVTFAASYKRPSKADASKWAIEGSFQTQPQPLNGERAPLPIALDLASLYEQIVRRHIPLTARAGESITEQVGRFNAIEARKKAQRQLEVRLGQEKQFNRKVELNAQLRSLSQELEALTHV